MHLSKQGIMCLLVCLSLRLCVSCYSSIEAHMPMVLGLLVANSALYPHKIKLVLSLPTQHFLPA